MWIERLLIVLAIVAAAVYVAIRTRRRARARKRGECLAADCPFAGAGGCDRSSPPAPDKRPP